MHYLVTCGLAPADLPSGCRIIADGETIAFEQPWDFGATLIARVGDGADLSALQGRPGVTAILVEGAAEPDDGQAIAIGAHIMCEPEGFKPYAAGVPAVIRDYGCNYLARGGKVTVLAGAFAPTRVVLMQFPDAEAITSFYFSDGYAPLLPIRIATTEPRFVLMARSGRVPDNARRVIAARLPTKI
jgi:uncharacterized protein (DUF1330 family)